MRDDLAAIYGIDEDPLPGVDAWPQGPGGEAGSAAVVSSWTEPNGDRVTRRMSRAPNGEWAGSLTVEPARADSCAPPRFKLERMGSLEVRPIAWLVRGLLELDTLATFFSDPNVGKSFLAIDLAASVASGAEFHGLEVARGPVIYLAGEGANGLARRRMAWEIRRQIKLDDAPLFVSRAPAALCDPRSALEVCDAIDQIVAEHGAPVLVVVDTLARNFGPGDENSTADMGGFIASADLIRSRYGCAVLLIHHTGHGDKTRARGAMALHGALDASYRLDKDETGVIRLEAVKMKDAPPPRPMAFRLRTVELGIEDDQGEQITSAVLDSTAYEPPEAPGRAGRGKWQTVALEVLEKLELDRRTTLESSGLDASTARVSIADWRAACLSAEMPRTRFYEVRDSLAEGGRVLLSGGFARISGESCTDSVSVRFPIGKPDRTGQHQTGQTGRIPDSISYTNRTEEPMQ